MVASSLINLLKKRGRERERGRRRGSDSVVGLDPK